MTDHNNIASRIREADGARILAELEENAAQCRAKFGEASTLYAAYPGLQHKVEREKQCLDDAEAAIDMFKALLNMLEELTRDAARYRGWRNETLYGRNPARNCLRDVRCTKKEVDAAIDAAMKEQG